MAYPFILIFHETALATGLEWTTKYHLNDVTDLADKAQQLANAEAPLVSDQIAMLRWEYYNALGHKSAEGEMGTPVFGDINNSMVPIHYALLIRQNGASTPGRPSQRYIHGYTESFIDAGALNATGLAAIANYGTELAGEGYVTDSDGVTVTSVTFRGFSRRKRMRRKLV